LNRFCADGDILAGTIEAGTVLIEEGAYVPESLRLDSARDAQGWKAVEPADRHKLERNISRAGLIFFLMADEIKATVFGFDQQKAVRAALQQIIASVRLQGCNSLQITQVAAKSFLRIPFVSVSARSRHIQERPGLDGQ
jgi:hypothetical protein